MPKRTYHVEPQRLGDYGYEACAPHAAARFVIIETTTVPAKNSRGRRVFIRKLIGNFSVSAGKAEARANEVCARFTAASTTKPREPQPRKGGIWGRSLTTAEYDEVMGRQRTGGRND